MTQETGAIEQLLTHSAVARAIGKSERTVHRLVKIGALPVVRIPHTRGARFRPSAIAALIERASTDSAPEAA